MQPMAELASAPIYRKAEQAMAAGDVETLERLIRDHGEVFRHEPTKDARALIARAQFFETWDDYAAFAARAKDPHSPVGHFETTVEAVVSGDEETLQSLLRQVPNLIRARSERTHHATLLHYVGANGVEGFRQRTPKNAVGIATILLDAGADVDALADMYGGSTTLGLVATSCHPRDAGLQEPLIEILLAHGAVIDGAGASGPGGIETPLVNSCLANGRPEAAAFLVTRGARLDLEGASGVGRLDVVRTFFDADGTLKPTATRQQRADGFSWACEYDQIRIIEYLLDSGMNAGTRLRPHGQSGLHWAAIGGHLETIDLLLKRGAPIDLKDESFNGTALDWVLFHWLTLPEERLRTLNYYEVAARLVAAGATVDWQWIDHAGRAPLGDMVRADAKMLEALTA